MKTVDIVKNQSQDNNDNQECHTLNLKIARPACPAGKVSKPDNEERAIE